MSEVAPDKKFDWLSAVIAVAAIALAASVGAPTEDELDVLQF